MNILIIVFIFIIVVLAILIPLVLKKSAILCAAPLEKCSNICYDPSIQTCIDNKISPRCSLPSTLCGDKCIDTFKQKCVNGIPQNICPDGYNFCGNVCYNPYTSVCTDDKSILLKCGQSVCSTSQVCGPNQTCVSSCISSEPICDSNTTSTTYCYFIGIQGPFNLFINQRYYSYDKKYYIHLSTKTKKLSIYNASGVELTRIADNINVSAEAVVQFQNDSNITILSKVNGEVLFGAGTQCAKCPEPQYNIVDGALEIIRDGKVAHRIGYTDPHALVSYIQSSLPPIDLPTSRNDGACSTWTLTEDGIDIITGLFSGALDFTFKCFSADGFTFNTLWSPDSDGDYFIRRMKAGPGETFPWGSRLCYSEDKCGFNPQNSTAYHTTFSLNKVKSAVNWVVFANLKTYWTNVLNKFSDRCTICNETTGINSKIIHARDIYGDLVEKFPYTTLTQLAFFNWPLIHPSIMRLGNGVSGESWIIFDTDDISMELLNESFRRPSNTGCVARFFVDKGGVASLQVNFISLDVLKSIPDYSKALLEPKGVVQDYLYFLFLKRHKRAYPYLTDSELDVSLLGRGQLYSKLVVSWLKYYSQDFKVVSQNRRFNTIPTLLSTDIADNSTKRVKDYNLNSEEGVKFCNVAPKVCNFVMDQICKEDPANFIQSTELSTDDVLAGIKTHNIHVESDTCRRYFSENTDQKDIVSKYLKPYCQDASRKFADTTFRNCCSELKTNECEQVNSLFTDNGNCSCYIRGNDLSKLYGTSDLLDELNVGGINGACYSDCILNTPSYDLNTSYSIAPCNSNICIISQTSNVNIYNSKIESAPNKQIACCSNLSDTSCAPKSS